MLQQLSVILVLFGFVFRAVSAWCVLAPWLLVMCS
jgi:hypothetical protein